MFCLNNDPQEISKCTHPLSVMVYGYQAYEVVLGKSQINLKVLRYVELENQLCKINCVKSAVFSCMAEIF